MDSLGYKVTAGTSSLSDCIKVANWVYKSMAKDSNIITSRKPSDLPLFNSAIILALGG